MRLVAAILFAALAAPALAVPGGQIGSLRPGAYQCEMPGDATGAVGLRAPEADFDIINANTYATVKGRGTYLLTGDLLQLTSGPLHGAKYHRVSNNFMRQIGPDGQVTQMRCVRRMLYRL